MNPVYPVTPLAFLVLVVVMLVVIGVHAPKQALLGVVVVLAGLPVYEVFRSKLAPIFLEQPQ